MYSGDDRSRHLDCWLKTDRSPAATLVSWSGVALMESWLVVDLY